MCLKPSRFYGESSKQPIGNRLLRQLNFEGAKPKNQANASPMNKRSIFQALLVLTKCYEHIFLDKPTNIEATNKRARECAPCLLKFTSFPIS